jgi:hypothetical protein
MRLLEVSKKIVLETQTSRNQTLSKELSIALKEATIKAPVSHKEKSNLESLLKEKIPASLAIFVIYDTLHDDELFSELNSLAETDPEADARDVIFAWISNNMPHLTYTVDNSKNSFKSVIGSD